MKRNWIHCGLVALAFLMAGCASMQTQKEKVFPAARPDKGLVYFYRESKFAGSAISYNIRHNGEAIGAIGNGTYFFYFADPGRQTFVASTEADVSRTLHIVPGNKYYISCGVDFGFWVARPSMNIVSAQEGESVLPGLDYAIKPSEGSRTTAAPSSSTRKPSSSSKR